MATARSNGIDLHVVERGRGDQTVVFSHSFLVDHRHFEPQIAALEDRYRVVAYDHRDHGKSGRAGSRYGIDDLVADGAAVIEQTGAAPCHWVGLSTGGFVGMRLAIRRPELLRSVTLMDTAGSAEPLGNRIQYRAMLAVIRTLGVRPLLGTAMKKMFGKTTLGDPDMAGELAIWKQRIAANDPAALVRFGKAIWSRDDVLEALSVVDIPALVVSGAEDAAIPPRVCRRIADAIDGARYVEIPGAGHLCTVEKPGEVNRELASHIDECSRGD